MRYNKVIIAGRIVVGPELTERKNVKTVKLIIADNKSYKKDNEWETKTSYFEAEAYGKYADIIIENYELGEEILIEGELEQKRWKDEDGKTKNKIVISVEKIQKIQKNKKPDKNKNQKRLNVEISEEEII